MTGVDHHDDAEPVVDLAANPAAAEALGLAASHDPAPAVRDRVLAGAVAARPPGRPAVVVEAIGPAEALRRTLVELQGLVASLTDDDARRPTIERWTVAGLLGHLTAVEAHTGAVLGWWSEDPIDQEHDHLAMTLPAVRAAESQPFSEARGAWADAVDRVVARLDSLDDRMDERVQIHGFDFSIRSLLIARTFEVWTHTEDICRAVGRPPLEPDTARLRLMTEAAVGALPIGMLLNGVDPGGRSVRIVLTGDGGGSWVQALDLGAPPGEPELTLVADAVEFCRVAAKRRSPSDLSCTVVGDADLAADVLTAAAVFAA